MKYFKEQLNRNDDIPIELYVGDIKGLDLLMKKLTTEEESDVSTNDHECLPER